MNGREALRGALDGMSKRFPEGRAQMLARLKGIFKHSITTEQTSIPLNRFNCFACAFSLTEHQDYEALIDATKSSAALSSTEVERMLDSGELIVVDAEDAEDGDIVIYRCDGTITHAGRVVTATGRIASKWGANELHTHELWEVPVSYGNDVTYVRAADANAIIETLIAKSGSSG